MYLFLSTMEYNFRTSLEIANIRNMNLQNRGCPRAFPVKCYLISLTSVSIKEQIIGSSVSKTEFNLSQIYAESLFSRINVMPLTMWAAEQGHTTACTFARQPTDRQSTTAEHTHMVNRAESL